MKTAKGIFVFGKERSGTKWVTNLIANHPSVACIQSEKHNGVHETNMFVQYPRAFGPLKVHENRLAFYHTFTNSFYFAISGVEKDWVFHQGTESYMEFFDLFMAEFARVQHCSHWVQKTNSSNLGRVKHYFRSNKYIIIQRDLQSTLVSSLSRSDAPTSTKQLIAATIRYVYLHRYEMRFSKRSNVLVVHYKDLTKRTEETLKTVYDFIGLSYDSAYTKVHFKANSTFTDKKRKRLTKGQMSIVKTVAFITRFLPASMLKWLRRRIQKQRNHARRFVTGTFD